MAERHNYGDRYGRDERPLSDRAGDEMRSWLGDEDAARRRRIDEAREDARDRDRDYAQRSYEERGYGSRYTPERNYSTERDYSSSTADRSYNSYGDRPFGDRDRDREYAGGRDRYSEPRALGPDVSRDWRGGDNRDYGRDYSGVSYGLSGGHGGDADIRRTGAGLEAGYANFHRPGAPDWSPRDSRDLRRDEGRDVWRVPGPHAGRGPRGYQRSDDRIREEVNDRLTAHGLIDATDVDAQVSGGEVTLTGFVDSRRAKRAAEDVAEEVDGVREVHNQLRVRTSAADHEGVGRTSVLGITESSAQTAATAPAETRQSRTRS